METQYSIFHIVDDWNIMKDIIVELSPEYIPAFEKKRRHTEVPFKDCQPGLRNLGRGSGAGRAFHARPRGRRGRVSAGGQRRHAGHQRLPQGPRQAG